MVARRRQVLDPAWFVPRLQIVDRQGRVQTLAEAGLSEEQGLFIEAWKKHRNILVLKPRQIGQTTITQACSFHLGFTAKDPIGILTTAHEDGAAGRVNEMLRQFYYGLPQALQFGLAKDNARELRFAHNGAAFRQLMAGGRSQGRSFTYQAAIFTEMGLYPRGSAAVEGSAVDAALWASVMATLHHGPYTRVVVESTGNGPSGKFYDLCKVAQRSDDWKFLFFRWFDMESYRRPAGPEFYPLTPEEEELKGVFGLTDEQLAWRRWKMESENYSLTQFRREYPATWEEPFLLDSSTWFDADRLNRILARLDPGLEQGPGVHVYLPFEPGRRYALGADTSGGTGRDWSVGVVVRDDGAVAAVYRSNTDPPHVQAEQFVRLAAMYGGCVILCEENNYGRAVINRMEELGGNTWKDERYRNFWTQGGRAGQTKKMVYSYARDAVDTGAVCSHVPGEEVGIRDPVILVELLVVSEDERGNIQAPEGCHDDHADAYVLALWAARGYYRPVSPEEQPRQSRREQFDRLVREWQ